MFGLGNYITVELFMALVMAVNWPTSLPFPASLLALSQDWIKEMRQWGKEVRLAAERVGLSECATAAGRGHTWPAACRAAMRTHTAHSWC